MKIILFTILAAATAAADETSLADLLQRSNNQFTSKMFTEVTKSNPGKSVVMSAFSVLTPLAQLSIASEGESHDEILRAISLPNDNATVDVFKYANSNVRSVKGVTLKMASRVYVAENYKLNSGFQKTSFETFGSEVKNIDFIKNEAAALDINHWVEDQTNNRIKNLVEADSLTVDTRAVLVNAIYFKGSWDKKFDSNLTIDRDFHVSSEKTIKVPTMSIKGDYKYGESQELDAKLLKLPYEGGEASMLIVLPNKIDGLAALEEKLKDPEALGKAVEKMYTFEVDVLLPKFKIETTTDLKDVLEKIGVKGLFGPTTAKLNKLLEGEHSGDGLYVSAAKQKAFIEVNEEGAEAAAANVFNQVGASGWIPKSVEFHADRPFYLDVKSGEHTLFNGVFVERGNK